MIAAIAAVKNEEDIIEANIRHLFANGIDLIRISEGMSTDGTMDILSDLKRHDFKGHLEVLRDRSPIFFQKAVMNQLLGDVRRRDYEWVIPFDADEFVVTHTGRLVSEVLKEQTFNNKLFLRNYLHLDWDNRVNNESRWPKVIIRPRADAALTMGNHEAHGTGLEVGYFHADLHIRELQFRSFDHYCSKVALNLETLDRSLPLDHAAHYRVLEGLDRNALEEQWQLYQNQPTVPDPVPSSFRPTTVTS